MVLWTSWRVIGSGGGHWNDRVVGDDDDDDAGCFPRNGEGIGKRRERVPRWIFDLDHFEDVPIPDEVNALDRWSSLEQQRDRLPGERSHHPECCPKFRSEGLGTSTCGCELGWVPFYLEEMNQTQAAILSRPSTDRKKRNCAQIPGAATSNRWVLQQFIHTIDVTRDGCHP